MTIDWQQLYQQRKAAAKKFGSIWQVPLRKRYHTVLAELGEANISLLEVGAGDRALQQTMSRYWGAFSYASCDIDATFEHDFASTKDLRGEYDLVAIFEMIEHVPLLDAAEVLQDCLRHLKPGGKIMLTTPNTYYPPAYLRDATHITPFCYDELAGLLSLCGFQVTAIYRLHHDSVIKKAIKRYLAYPLFRLLGIDFAHQIAVVAEKPA
ncbi:MAG: class I SAM-dependent methyltransferase [Pseudomonadales bacterium]